jgi:hypothetical protein
LTGKANDRIAISISYWIFAFQVALENIFGILNPRISSKTQLSKEIIALVERREQDLVVVGL